MNSMSLWSIYFFDNGNNFNWLVTLSKTLDMLDFADNTYVVDKSKYPRKVKDAGASRTWGKRKAVEVVDLESDEDVDVELDDEVQLPTNDSSRGLQRRP